MMAPVSMPDENGHVSLSLHSGAILEELVRAGRDPDRLLIVEASAHFPRTHALVGHENHLDLEDVDVIVYTDEQPTTFANDPGSPEDSKIAEFAARYIPDGATLQTGIGAVPNLVARALAKVTAVSTACTPRCSPTDSTNLWPRVRRRTRRRPSIAGRR